MSVTSCNLVDRGASIAHNGQKSATRTYLIETTDPVNDDEVVVISYSGLPVKYSSHPSDDSMWVDTLKAAPFEDRLHWKVTVEYIPKPGGQDVSDSEHPCDLPATVNYFTEYTKIAMKTSYDYAVDVFGDPSVPILNSAKDPFSDPAEVEVPRMGIRIVKNRRNEDVLPGSLALFVNTKNVAEIRVGGVTIPQYVGKMKDIVPTPQYDADRSLFWQVTYEIILDYENKWDYRPIDQGFNKRDPLSPFAKTRIRESGEKSSIPVLLDGAGQPKADAAAAEYLRFQVLFISDWTGLDLAKEKDGN